MVTASSRDPLRRSLDGISAEIQGTDRSEVEYETGEFDSIFSNFPYSPSSAVLEKVKRAA
jgi:hypothetical protein